MKKFVGLTMLVAGLMLAAPNSSQAHEYDRDDSDYPLRYVAYVVHPIGMAVEYAILRPIHWFVSKPNASKWCGHDPREEEEGTYFEWK